MTTQTDFAARSYLGEADLQPVFELIEACEAVDKLDTLETLDNLRLENSFPRMDQERDLRVWTGARDKVIAFARIEKPAEEAEDADTPLTARLFFWVHPDARGQGLETTIIGWASHRVREIAGHERGAVLHSAARDYFKYGRELLEAHGFKPDRYFIRMVRSLNDPIPEPVFPEGYSLGYAKDDDDLREWIRCFNESFIDHWNFHPLVYEEARHWNDNNVNYKPESDLVAVAADGQFAAFCYCEVDDEYNRRNDLHIGWIHLLGTRRGHRKQGLGRAMLYAGFNRLKDLGADTAKLGVDADNPTGAVDLYESVGFRKDVVTVIYSKEV